MKFGIFYELQLPRPWQAGDELKLYQDALTQLETADRLRLRPCLGGGASFPGGIFALAVAGIVSRRRLPAHQEHPARPRHLPAHHQSSRPRRRARRGARSAQQRPLRIRHGRERLDHRADAVRPRHGNQEGSVRGSRPRHLPDVQGGRQRASRQVFRYSPAQRGAEAGAEAASAAVDGVLAIADHRARRPERLWRARLPVRQRGRRARLGARLLQRDHKTAEEARRLPDQSEHGAGVVLHVRQDRRGGPRARRRRHLLPVRAALLRPGTKPGASGARHRQHVGRIQQVEARKSGSAGGRTARRPDRLAGNHPPRSCGGSAARTSTR